MRIVTKLAALVLALSLLMLIAVPAFAHESRNAGPYRLTVGFNVEPAYTYLMNGAHLRVRNVSDLTPVTGLAAAMKVEVTYAGTVKTFDMKAVSGQDGLYVAEFLPTATGRYTFRFFGKVGDQAINETFTSGPGTFSDMNPLADAGFPVAAPDQIASQQAAKSASDAAAAAADTAATARMLAIAGIAAGAAGIVLGGAGMAMAARRKP